MNKDRISKELKGKIQAYRRVYLNGEVKLVQTKDVLDKLRWEYIQRTKS